MTGSTSSSCPITRASRASKAPAAGCVSMVGPATHVLLRRRSVRCAGGRSVPLHNGSELLAVESVDAFSRFRTSAARSGGDHTGGALDARRFSWTCDASLPRSSCSKPLQRRQATLLFPQCARLGSSRRPGRSDEETVIVIDAPAAALIPHGPLRTLRGRLLPMPHICSAVWRYVRYLRSQSVWRWEDEGSSHPEA